MTLSSSQLEAFAEVARVSSFSKAAKNLSLTQSALSQRVKNLEDELGTALLIREPSGLRLTLAGEELVQYCKNKQAMESECLARIHRPRSGSLAGVIRVGGYSTVMRSLILPALTPLLMKNPEVRIESLTKEMRELPPLLKRGETDYILLDHPLEKEGVETQLLGYEENVLIESKSARVRGEVYLDHDSEDDTTHRFFAAQTKKPKKMQRAFLDEIYGIIDGVAFGLGRAVVPSHLLEGDRRIQIVSGFKPLRVPVFLNYYRQPFYTQLQKAVTEHLTRGAVAQLGK